MKALLKVKQVKREEPEKVNWVNRVHHKKQASSAKIDDPQHTATLYLTI
jgi:hypothetical protein